MLTSYKRQSLENARCGLERTFSLKRVVLEILESDTSVSDSLFLFLVKKASLPIFRHVVKGLDNLKRLVVKCHRPYYDGVSMRVIVKLR